MLALGTLMPCSRIGVHPGGLVNSVSGACFSVMSAPRQAHLGSARQHGRGARDRSLAASTRLARGGGEDEYSEEDLLKLIRGSYEDLIEVASRPGMVKKLEEAAAKGGFAAQMRLEVALSEAKSAGQAKSAAESLLAADAEADRSRAEANLRRVLEEVRGISEALYFRPIADRFANAMDQAAAAGVDPKIVSELKTEAITLLKEHKERFSFTPKTLTGQNAGDQEYDMYNR